MKKKYKVLIEIIAFILLLTICIRECYNAVRFKDTANGGGMENFYDVEGDIDVMFFGSSHVGCTINNSILWENYGISNYTLWVAAQKGNETYYYMKEAFKYMKPKVAVVETLMLANADFEVDDIYRTALTTRWSPDYLKYVVDITLENDLSREFAEELYFKMPIVHSRYKELTRYDFFNTNSYNRGYKGSNEIEVVEPPLKTDKRAELSANALQYIDGIIELCEENDVELLFFNAPFSAGEEDMMIQNSIMDYLSEKGCTYIGFNHEYEKYGIDFNTDMREVSHLNDTGAAKVTNVIADFLVENYTFDDHRGDLVYSDWDKHLIFLKNKQDGYELGDCENIEDYIRVLGTVRDKYSIIVSFNGDYKAYETYADRPDFSVLGIDEATYDKGGTVVIKNGEFDYYSGELSEYSYYTEFDGGIDCNIYKVEDEEFNHVAINYFDLSAACNGFSIIVYDEDCYNILDYIYVDVYAGSEIVHPVFD